MTPHTDLQARIARGPATWALAAGVTLSYCALFFSYPALTLYWMTDPGWPKWQLATGPVLALLIAACLAPLLGRQVDRGRGPALLLWGPVTGAAGLALVTFAQTPLQWVLAWSITGFAQAACFYEVVFAFVIRRMQSKARAAIIRITLVAGFASALAYPFYATISALYGWRATLIAAAGILVLLVAPLNLWACRRIRREAPPPVIPSRDAIVAPLSPAQKRATLLLTILSVSIATSHWMSVTYLVPILVLQGYSEPVAVTLAACMGPAQVLARLAMMLGEGRISNMKTVQLILVSTSIAAAALLAAPLGIGFAIIYVMLQGAAFGAMTITRPVLISDVLGAENYGANAGRVLMPMLFASAIAPMITAVLLEKLGLELLMCLAFALLAAGFMALKALSGSRSHS